MMACVLQISGIRLTFVSMRTEDAIPDLDPYDDEYSESLRRIEKLAYLFDARFEIPGTNIRIGWDGLIGLLPGVGDTLTLLPQLYLLFEAIRLKLGTAAVFKMLLNILIDWLLGSVPVLGDLFDVAFKSNLRNAKIVAEAIREKRADASI
jgi:hypothetical protein